MKLIDKLIKGVLGAFLIAICVCYDLVIYVLALIVAIYESIKGNVNFVKELNDLNVELIDSMKKSIRK